MRLLSFVAALFVTACIPDYPRRWSCQFIGGEGDGYFYLYGEPEEVKEVMQEWADACQVLTGHVCWAFCIEPPKAHEF